ncbi:MAG: protein phosphatase 2C domain-containing protein [Bacteroidia bacterium]|nr:protein phosphatase 2C domain-containing protein [Bacteroidia bacterium]
MKLIEEFLQGKTGKAEENEDFMFFSENFAAVIDGVTAKRPEMAGTGRIAAEIIHREIFRLPAETTWEEALEIFTQAIFSHYQQTGIAEAARHDPRLRMGAVTAVFSVFHREIWLMGDCQCLINGHFYENPASIDAVMSEARALYNHIALQTGKNVEDLASHDPGREFISPILQQQSLLQNNPAAGEYAFFVIDGFTPMKNQVKIISVNKGDEIVLATDGYPRLSPTLEASEKKLREIITRDPMLISLYKSTKGVKKGNISFDDRAYLRFLF